MKEALLLTIFLGLFTISAFSQLGDCGNCATPGSNTYNYASASSQQNFNKKKITVYPNPATNYIELSDTENVEMIKIYNIIGKEVATFEVQKDGRYNIADLVKGMYLVRIIDNKNDIVTTQRLNVR